MINVRRAAHGDETYVAAALAYMKDAKPSLEKATALSHWLVDHGIVLVAEADGGIVGHLAAAISPRLLFDGRQADVIALGSAKAGAGTALLRAFLALVDVDMVMVHVDPDPRLRRYFRRFGLEPRESYVSFMR